MKKRSTLKKLALLVACSMLATISNAQLFVNGPFINSPGTGPAGTDESWLFDASLMMSNFGYGANATTFYRCADDFVVPVGQTWNIDSVFLYCYQTNAPTAPSPITKVNIRIMTDVSGLPGTVVWGDTTTNRLDTSYWTNSYRVLESATGTSTARAIFKNVCSTPALSLTAGTYWLDWQYKGSASLSGPWVNPITIAGNATTGNGAQVVGAQNPYAIVLDPGSNTPQGFPFSVFGTIISGIENHDLVKNISVYPNPATDFINLQVNLSTEMPMNIQIINELGQVVYTEDKGNQIAISQEINCKDLASGFYFMKVNVGNGFVMQKFTKQ